ncbi:ABC transporter substrate-binding protein [Ileibacterium valens]|uniref:ABC transporter substrate-binding protein n=1 Tax=Ileibacterium valens TaxID=1862668 RepID=A0A1U7NIA8_9FIRM|nr:ABC transporter substrate-binding protein [Ileibacterium valens]OLU40724.1 ABC transporter substrate-binding protein [Erysipelotrichaceae bacterium NYU-BL-F16]OLU42096.1 ABC transporter substrate-binding protein [Ileibacterium valens]OLU42797.1 ABC transporter substrate-binding protein [Erysipelotrichaceae bacterium NYU-BL-E8]
MKKWQNLVAVCAMSVSVLAGCSSTSSDAADSNGEAGAADGAKGSVYYLNFKPEQDEAWQNLAKKYTEETGVDVKVVTAASGNYETTLMSEMGKSGAPTLFQVNGPVGLKNWEDYAYNLYDTPVFNQLTSDAYALFVGKDDVAAIAYCIESYGIIVNTTLLDKAGYKVEDIQSFEDLKKVADDITARKDELNFSAFTSAGMDGSSDWRFKAHLANMPIYFEYQEDGITDTDAIKGTYLDNYRDIFDLYITDSTTPGKDLAAKTGDDSRNEFISGEAVFYQNGSWEYNELIKNGLKSEEITMIPVYIGAGDEANQGLTTGTENYWVVNKEASEEDIQATLDFMNWCVTSEEGTTAMADEMGFVIPFKDAKPSENVFVLEDVKLTEEGKTPVSWNFTTMPSEEWKNALGSALTAYAADPTDANWEEVEKAFVENWKTEYDLANN